MFEIMQYIWKRPSFRRKISCLYPHIFFSPKSFRESCSSFFNLYVREDILPMYRMGLRYI